MKMSSAYKFITMQMKLILIRKVLHEGSFWDIGPTGNSYFKYFQIPTSRQGLGE